MADRWKRIAPLSGVLLVGAYVALLAIGSTPDTQASGAKVQAFYNSHHGRTGISVALAAFAAIFAIGYYASVSTYLRSRGSDLLAQTTMAGGILFAAGSGLAAGTLAVLSDKQDKLGLGTLQTLNVIQNDLWWPCMFAGLAVATLSMGVAMLRTHSLPKALGIVTVVVGVVAFTGIGTWFAFLASGPLTIVIAGFVYQRFGRPASITMPDVPAQRDGVATSAEADAKVSTRTTAS